MFNRGKMYASIEEDYFEDRNWFIVWRDDMAFIVDRLILIFLSLFLLLFETSITKIIVFALVAIIISGFSYFLDSKKCTALLGGCYLIGCVFQPELILVAPVIVYELYANKLTIEIILLGVWFVLSLEYLSPIAIAVIVLFSLIACVLYYKSAESERLSNLVKHIRDDSEERAILLAEKNKHLMEKQDQEVYVATLKERNRIAREIHDNVGHMITRSILQMGALMTINKEEPLHGQLESVKNNLDVAMNNIRESVHDLHDESVDLKQAIMDLIAELKDKFDCRLDYDAGNHMDRKYKYAIIGIVKEAVSNIIKHSKNDKVDIILREHPGMIQLVVHDYNSNQKNYSENKEPSAAYIKSKSDGIGLTNMQDRVRALNGNISIETNKGFKIFITFPRN